ncbi:MAG: hypothetical protein QHH15_04660 [Candidatus Thermoplasmatota archaeon]|jgi:hypothetical protein|nr:hypothetical protein [Candidatus Thermoplasmatota archaeon]
MKKYLVMISTALFISFILFSGCIQQKNNKNISGEIELVHHEINRYGNNTFEWLEVTGAIRKIGNATIDHAIVGVYFYNNKNQLIYYGNYSIYSFVKGYDYDFFVVFSSNHPKYKEYDHYSIELDYV